MKVVCTIALLLFVNALHAQTRLSWSAPIAVHNGGYGATRPQMVLCNGVPVIVWSDFMVSKTYASRFVGGVFTVPVVLGPASFESYALDWTGPDIASNGDVLFVTLVNNVNGKPYLIRSNDGGVTFGDTVRIDGGDESPAYPTVEVMADGNPAVMYKRYNSSNDLYEFVLRKSGDGGATFGPSIVTTSVVNGQPCDCCPGSLVVSDNKLIMAYRNNDSDYRDIWSTLSTDGGDTFATPMRIDSSDWHIELCPSSAASAYISGDNYYAVFMNAKTGKEEVYISSVNASTLEIHANHIFMNTGIDLSQNFPRLAGTGDTITAVWRQSVENVSEVMFAHSFNGINGIENTVDTLTNVMFGYQSYPDVACDEEWVRVVFKDQETDKVYYMEANLGSHLSVADIEKAKSFDVQRLGGKLYLMAKSQNNNCSIRLLSVTGQTLFEKDESVMNKGDRVELEIPDVAGVCLLSVVSSTQTFAQKVTAGF